MRRFLIAFLAVCPLLANAQMGSGTLESAVDTAAALFPVPLNTAGSINFPTAFRWNRNGPTGGYWNDTYVDDNIFRPVARNIAKYNLKVYNRKGLLVYETSELHKGWDGYLENGDLAYQGVYIWQVTGTYSDGSAFSKQGDVTFLY